MRIAVLGCLDAEQKTGHPGGRALPGSLSREDALARVAFCAGLPPADVAAFVDAVATYEALPAITTAWAAATNDYEAVAATTAVLQPLGVCNVEPAGVLAWLRVDVAKFEFGLRKCFTAGGLVQEFIYLLVITCTAVAM